MIQCTVGVMAYNEEQNIARVIKSIRQFVPGVELLVAISNPVFVAPAAA